MVVEELPDWENHVTSSFFDPKRNELTNSDGMTNCKITFGMSTVVGKAAVVAADRDDWTTYISPCVVGVVLWRFWRWSVRIEVVPTRLGK